MITQLLFLSLHVLFEIFANDEIITGRKTENQIESR